MTVPLNFLGQPNNAAAPGDPISFIDAIDYQKRAPV
jgi:hypothetical protein